MKNTDIKDLSVKELYTRVKEEKLLYNKLKFGHAVTPLENPQKIKTSRRLIARLLTETKRRQIDAIKAAESNSEATNNNA
jgi:large subunit ribosomal protein L29